MKSILSSFYNVSDSNDGTEEVDLNYISCDYHILISIGVSLGVSESEKSSLEALVIGLGGGVVSTLLHRCFPKVSKFTFDIKESYDWYTMLKFL